MIQYAIKKNEIAEAVAENEQKIPRQFCCDGNLNLTALCRFKF
jgi:hypothetical protein